MKFLLLLFTLFTISAQAQTSGKTLGGNYPSGFYGFRNYMLNPGGEIDAQNVSVAGTNGTIGVFSNNPITNKKSFRVGGDLNTNITGTFTAAPFDQGLGDSTNNCAAAFNLQPNGVGTYTMNVKLGSTTVATRSFTTTSGIPVQFQTFLFSCGAFGLTPTIDIIANLTSGSGTDHYQADDFYMGQDPGLVQSLRIATQEQPYTPVYTGFGTVSTSNMKWYQDGAYLYVYGSFLSGTPTGVEARMSFPTSYTASSTISTLMLCGDAGRDSSSTTLFRYGMLCEPNVSYLTFGVQNSTTNVVTKSVGTTITTAGNVIHVNAKIPIQGVSNVIGVPASCINNPDCQNNFSAKVGASGTVTDENYEFINGNCTNASGAGSCTFSTSRFGVAPTCVLSVNDAGATAYFLKLGAVSPSTTTLTWETRNNGTTLTSVPVQILCSRSGTDVKPWGPIPWLTGMVSSNATTSERIERARFTCSSSSSISSQSGSWLTSIGNISGGVCAIVWPSNTWATAPSCTLGMFAGAANNRLLAKSATETTTGMSVVGFEANTATPLTTYTFDIICMGPR